MSAKPDLSELTLTQLSELVRSNPRTVRRRLDQHQVKPSRQDGRALFYRPWEALPAICGGGSGDRLDPGAEQARLAKARADLAELELSQKRGELMEKATVTAIWMEILARVKARVLGIPAQCAIAVSAESDPKRAHGIIEAECRAALSELAEAKGF